MKTLDYYLNQPEGQTYDKKSGRILPGRVRINNMRTTHFSRNPKIAAFMKEYEFIREFGEGVDRMYRELEEGGWPKPVFKQDDFMLRASLKSGHGVDGLQNNSTNQIENQTDNLDALQKTLQKTLQKQDVSIIMLLLNDPNLTTQKIAEQLQVSRQTIATRIKKLQQEGYVKRIGPDKGGRWEVIV